MVTNLPGIDPALASRTDPHILEAVTHPRSGAEGTYKRGDQVVPNYPINQHRKMVEKGFLLVAITFIPHGTLDAPWLRA